MDLIDRGQAVAYLEKHKELARANMILLAADEDAIIKFLKTQCKTVDAVPVVHAHWVMRDVVARTPFGRNCFCSSCGYEPIEQGRHCPNCGAKMDGGEQHGFD